MLLRISSLKKFGINFLYKKLQNIDNLYAQKISPNDKQRIVRAIEVKTSTGKSILEWQKNSRKKIFKKILYIVIKTDKEVLYSRINKRCQEMINLGVVEEVNKDKQKVRVIISIFGRPTPVELDFFQLEMIS